MIRTGPEELANRTNSSDRPSRAQTAPAAATKNRLRTTPGASRPKLDGEIADAPAGVEHTGFSDRLRRASDETSSAGAAVFRSVRLVRLHLQVGQQRPEQEIAAALLVDEHGVLADPAEAGPAGEV